MNTFNKIAQRGLIGFFLIGNAAFAQTATKDDVVDNLLGAYMAENHVPGFAACVVKKDKITWSKGYGDADIDRDIPMNIDAIMNIASISKTITATAIMQLWEKGMIDLNADVNDYLTIGIRNPNYPDTPITVHHLLTHASTIKDGFEYSKSYACGDPTISLKYWIDNYLAKGGAFYHEKESFHSTKPGSSIQYSNVGFGLLGYIVEEVSHMPFNEYCKENIFSPLKMVHTGWFISEIDTTNHVTPYIYIDQERVKDQWIKKLAKADLEVNDLPLNENFALCLYSFPNYPDGLIRTSVRELSYFMAAMMNEGAFNGNKILNKSTISKMLDLQIEGNDSQGICWSKYEFESLWGHGGGDPGVGTTLVFSPESKIGIITFQNNSSGDSFNIVKELYWQTKNGE